MNDFFDTQQDSDLTLLQTLTDSDKLTTQEREAFERMSDDLTRRSVNQLTFAQRQWAQNVKKRVLNNARQIELLRTVLDEDGLKDSEREAFSDMLSDLQSTCRELTTAQQMWLTDVARREGCDAQNLYSAGKVPKGFERKEKLLPWEQPGYVKPTKPPGHKKT